MATFGVVAADISAMSQGMTFGASTTPTSSEVGELITMWGAHFGALLYSKSLDPDGLATTDPAYRQGQLFVRYRVASHCMRVSAHRREIADSYEKIADSIEKMITKSAAVLGSSMSTSTTNAPDLMRTSFDLADEIETDIDDNGSLVSRMRKSREL